jgi:hypothetical protein
MQKLLLVICLSLPLLAYAISDENLIKQADKLNGQCRGGSDDNPATMRACDKRDKLVDELASKGWCYGHEGQAGYERQWEKCTLPQPLNNTDPLVGRAGGWFKGAREIMLRTQLANCENFKIAGNTQLYKSCNTRTLNAHDYLLERANNSKLPIEGWGFCSTQIQYDFPHGAQCLAAVELLCPPNENKDIADFKSCYNVMTSGAWMSNPNIQRMSFTTPAR